MPVLAATGLCRWGWVPVGVLIQRVYYNGLGDFCIGLVGERWWHLYVGLSVGILCVLVGIRFRWVSVCFDLDIVGLREQRSIYTLINILLICAMTLHALILHRIAVSIWSHILTIATAWIYTKMITVLISWTYFITMNIITQILMVDVIA